MDFLGTGTRKYGGRKFGFREKDVKKVAFIMGGTDPGVMTSKLKLHQFPANKVCITPHKEELGYCHIEIAVLAASRASERPLRSS